MLIIKKKTIYERFDTEVKLPAILNIQTWDNDTFSADDFLGSLTINLSHFPKPFSTAEKCCSSKNMQYENLFAEKNVRGWFSLRGNNSKKGVILLKIIYRNKVMVMTFLNREKLKLNLKWYGNQKHWQTL